MKLLYTTFFSLLYFFSLAQNGTPSLAGARGGGMGNAGVAFQDINSAFSNQAGLAFLESLSFVAVHERRFMLSEISASSAAVALPMQSGTVGLTFNYYGFSDYNEQKIGLAYARKLMEKVAVGAQFNYLNTSIAEYGNNSTFTFEIGLQSELAKNFILAAHVFSPIRVEIIEGEDIPTILTAGVAYHPTEDIMLVGSVEKDMNHSPAFKGGIEYKVIDDLFLRAGVQTGPATMSFGVGYQLKASLFIDAGVNYHQTLGYSPSISIGYRAPKK